MKSKNEKTLAGLPEIDETSTDFRQFLVILLARSNASNRMEALTADTNAKLLELIEAAADEWAELQQIIADCDPQLLALAVKHPEWFGDKKSVRTPCGTVKFHRSTVLEVANEEVTILLIETALKSEIEQKIAATTEAARLEHHNMAALLNGLVKPSVVLDIEALEQLDDGLLAQFRISRRDKENFSVVPAALDLGKAIAGNKKDATEDLVA